MSMHQHHHHHHQLQRQQLQKHQEHKKREGKEKVFYLLRRNLSSGYEEYVKVFQGPVLSPGAFVRDAITGYRDRVVRMNTHFEHMYYKISWATGEGDPYTEPIILFFETYKDCCHHLHIPFDQNVQDRWLAKFNEWKNKLGDLEPPTSGELERGDFGDEDDEDDDQYADEWYMH